MYLTRSSSILHQILNKALNFSIKKKDEKQFMNARLQLLDQQYGLEMDRQLWQSYLDIGLQQHLWPVSLFFNFILKSFLSFFFPIILRINFIRWQKQMISIYVNNM